MAGHPSPVHSPTNGDFSTYMTLRPDPRQDDGRATSLLTSYAMHTLSPALINNIVVRDGKKVKWENVTQRQVALPAEVITARIAELNKKEDITSKFNKLKKHQQGHITNLLTSRTQGELPGFQWTLSQLERQEQKLGHKLKETTILTLYIKKAPKEDLGSSPSALYRELHPHPVQQSKAPAPHKQHLGSGSKKPPGTGSRGKSHSSKHSKKNTIEVPINGLANLVRALAVQDRRSPSREHCIEMRREQMRERVQEVLEVYGQRGRFGRRDSFWW